MENGTLLAALAAASPVWAIEEAFLRLLVASRADFPAAHMPAAPRKARTEGARLHISVNGPILPGRSPILAAFGVPHTTWAEIRAGLARAEDPEIAGVILHVDSPGGTATGAMITAQRLRALTAQKPTVAFVGSICASAAYWLASQCGHIVAEPDASVGGIGCYMVIEDSSGAAEKEGRRVHVIRSAPEKGVGVPGAAIPPQALKTRQAMVNLTHTAFLADVAAGRGVDMKEAAAWATGASFLAMQASLWGVIDRTGDIGDALSYLPVQSDGPLAEAAPDPFAAIKIPRGGDRAWDYEIVPASMAEALPEHRRLAGLDAASVCAEVYQTGLGAPHGRQFDSTLLWNPATGRAYLDTGLEAGTYQFTTKATTLEGVFLEAWKALYG